MSFQQGLSGLNAAAKSLDAISNNVANSGTVGYKAAQAQFADVFAASLTGAGSADIGIGTTVNNVAQQFTQGNIEVTNNPLDIAINGGGFFRMHDNASFTFTRNGQFTIDQSGYIVNAAGYRLTGSGGADILIDKTPQPPTATTGATIGANLDAREPVIAGAIDIDDPTSYNSSTSITVYDSLGQAHTLGLYFQRATTSPSSWDVAAALDGTDITAGYATGTSITFGTDGLVSAGGTLTLSAVPVAGAANLSCSIDLTDATQYAGSFAVSSIVQDGYTAGNLSGLSVAADGTILGRYSNGVTGTLGQIALYSFNNPNGLESLGGNQWGVTAESGNPLLGTPGDGARGTLQPGAVEQSNVDLTAELVNMITAQRNYQANAQSIRTQDQLLQTLVNLR